MKANAKDAPFLTALRNAQRVWLAYRDAHLKALYPNPDPGYYGSSGPMCRCAVLDKLTVERARQLTNVWIDGVPEGDVCQGSAARAAR